MLVVNLIAPPGAGKSTGMAKVFYEAKRPGINIEMSTEFAKDKVYEVTEAIWLSQEYIFGKQSFKLKRIRDKVSVAVTDSPLLHSAFYNNDETLGEDFNKVVLNVFNSYDNLTYFINRVKPYNPSGRFQTEEESDAMGPHLKAMMDKYGVKYTCIDGDEAGYMQIVKDIVNVMNNTEDN